jgi:metal-responsive CopG/Arc/MetJ family transcriptional regulator
MVEIVLSARIKLQANNLKTLDSLVDKGVASSRDKVIEKAVKDFLDH